MQSLVFVILRGAMTHDLSSLTHESWWCVVQEGIDCKFQRVDGYLVPHSTGESSTPTSSTGALSKELDAAIR